MLDEDTGHQALVISRRDVIKAGICAALGAALVPSFPHLGFAAGRNFSASRKSDTREIAFRNSHTGESFSGVYRVGNKYLPDAFDEINMVLRDFRNNEVFPIDPHIVDIIYTVKRMTGRREPYEIISGYRSPRTNEMLRHASVESGVAKNSLHTTGRAIDLRIPGYTTRRIRDAGVSLRAGGVGYYPDSDFVHLDCGKVRVW